MSDKDIPTRPDGPAAIEAALAREAGTEPESAMASTSEDREPYVPPAAEVGPPKDEAPAELAAVEAALIPADAKSLGRAFYYDLPLEAGEVMAAIAGAEGVMALATSGFPEFGPPVRSSEFTATLGERSFVLHRAASERGQSGTGLLRSLFLRGRLHPTARGTMLELRFVYGRPSWAWQRAVGFVLVALLGIAWVFVGQGGEVMQRAIFVGAFLLLTTPLLLNDAGRKRRLESDQRELLALAERTFGPLSIGGGPGTPYRTQG